MQWAVTATADEVAQSVTPSVPSAKATPGAATSCDPTAVTTAPVAAAFRNRRADDHLAADMGRMGRGLDLSWRG
jgi:hypothetical protein